MKANNESKYDERSVVEQLKKKHDINIVSNIKRIEILQEPRAKKDIGIKSKGKLDFLTKYCGYHIAMVEKF